MSKAMTREELAINYSESYDVTDIDLRGEVERRTMGWYKKESDFERLIDVVIELVRISAKHGYEEGYNLGIRYGFEKARELTITLKPQYESAEQVIAELDKEQDDKR